MPDLNPLRGAVRQRYAQAAKAFAGARDAQPLDLDAAAAATVSDCCGGEVASTSDCCGGQTTPVSDAVGGQTAPVSDCCGGKVTSTSDCCGSGATPNQDQVFGPALYAAGDQGQVEGQVLATSLGCGNPVAVAELRPGETVLDLGSGGGLDVLLSAGRVGPTGFVYGLDMTDEMLELARANAASAGATNVKFLKGAIEAIPLPNASIDVVISNCVINLSTDKPAVFAEISRVLKPGGRIGLSDVVAEDHLSPAQRAERGTYVGCIAGALSVSEYRAALTAVGLADAELSFTHQVADAMHAAIIRATKPTT